MNQEDETDELPPECLAEHTDAIEQSSQSETDLSEPLDDHARLTKAIMILEQEMLREGGEISRHDKGDAT